METEPAKSGEPTAPENSDEEPLEAVPTRETTPAFAQSSESGETSDEYEPASPDESLDHGDPDWSEPEAAAASNGDGGKKTPEWAQTVPTDPGQPIPAELMSEELEQPEQGVESEAETPEEEKDEETEEEKDEELPAAAAEPAAPEEPEAPAIAATVPPATEESQPPVATEAEELPIGTEPPRAVAADATKSTWPPGAETPPAPPAETDIWPPEPPTEHTMPAWPPPSELEEPATPAQAIPSWPDSFDAVAPAASASTQAPTVKAPAVQATPPALIPKAGAPKLEAPAAPHAEVPHAPHAEAPPKMPVAQSAPPAPAPVTIPPSAAPAHTEPPVSPSQPGPPSRPSWAPHAPDAPLGETPPKTISPKGPLNVPAWAPRVPLASEPGTPTWFSPKEQVRHTAAQPASQPPPAAQSEPAPPIVGGQLPVAAIPPTPQPAAPQAAAGQQPGAQPTARPTWEVVNQPHVEKGSQGPTPEDRSYAEWFAWAKRGGAPASACHAAAQGAFKALAAGKDVQTAVQWATAAMSRPPENVSYTRQTYCAWFSLANIDLNLDQHRSHAFAMAAVHALDSGQDASAAHVAGLAAAGIR